ncbi:MAG: nuclear transport factor 2 family protein [Burkholderiales bacterium]
MKRFAAAVLLLVLASTPAFAQAPQEPDHEIHEALRAMLKEIVTAINTGQYDRMLPYLAENVEATSITQEVMSSRADVSKYFKDWFGPKAYMKKMEMKLEADRLTELSPDKTWGLARGKAVERYEANDGDVFDFNTRWTALMAKGDDGQWRLRAIHFGTNNLDNPVLTKVKNTLIRDGIIGAVVALLIGVGLGFLIARRRKAPT